MQSRPRTRYHPRTAAWRCRRRERSRSSRTGSGPSHPTGQRWRRESSCLPSVAAGSTVGRQTNYSTQGDSEDEPGPLGLIPERTDLLLRGIRCRPGSSGRADGPAVLEAPASASPDGQCPVRSGDRAAAGPASTSPADSQGRRHAGQRTSPLRPTPPHSVVGSFERQKFFEALAEVSNADAAGHPGEFHRFRAGFEGRSPEGLRLHLGHDSTAIRNMGAELLIFLMSRGR